ncbi:helix-turn-helix domain-containing protein [Corynebacterium riegelii]|uniref:helix-turn-helix domain-containing protein n=1 Tax=Corynebacterium riegelii TaxID=156976 RepID=UPI0023F497ED|nr:helix-turn-helix transcriptional regulator [Corynebacterium riegelii]
MLETLERVGVINSMHDFARRSGISHASIGRVIRGERWINGELLARLEDASGFRLWGEHTEKISEPRFDVEHR